MVNLLAVSLCCQASLRISNDTDCEVEVKISRDLTFDLGSVETTWFQA